MPKFKTQKMSSIDDSVNRECSRTRLAGQRGWAQPRRRSACGLLETKRDTASNPTSVHQDSRQQVLADGRNFKAELSALQEQISKTHVTEKASEDAKHTFNVKKTQRTRTCKMVFFPIGAYI